MYSKKNTKFTEMFNAIVEEMLNTVNDYSRRPTYGYNHPTNNLPTDFYGKTHVEKGVDENGNNWVNTTYTSNDGSYTYSTKYTTGTWNPTTNHGTNSNWLTNHTTGEWNPTNNYETKLNWASKYDYMGGTYGEYNNKTAGRAYSDRLATLKEELNRAVTEQKYEEAARLKRELDSALRNDKEYATLQRELDTLVKTHNFEKAIEVRDRIREYENKYSYTTNTNTTDSTNTTEATNTTSNTTTTGRKGK